MNPISTPPTFYSSTAIVFDEQETNYYAPRVTHAQKKSNAAPGGQSKGVEKGMGTITEACEAGQQRGESGRRVTVSEQRL
jgi:hypothetical protein